MNFLCTLFGHAFHALRTRKPFERTLHTFFANSLKNTLCQGHICAIYAHSIQTLLLPSLTIRESHCPCPISCLNLNKLIGQGIWDSLYSEIVGDPSLPKAVVIQLQLLSGIFLLRILWYGKMIDHFQNWLLSVCSESQLDSLYLNTPR